MCVFIETKTYVNLKDLLAFHQSPVTGKPRQQNITAHLHVCTNTCTLCQFASPQLLPTLTLQEPFFSLLMSKPALLSTSLTAGLATIRSCTSSISYQSCAEMCLFTEASVDLTVLIPSIKTK